ncbi:MAG TPA: hypothetical protein VGP48_02785 [Stellaceae bacterium]|nr:hypothetical protein [Stellaceae bacterium]
MIALALLLPTSSYAQATRTWVSGVGDDANPCSRTAPCKTWAGAISKTAAGGEIDALDPGGFGALTITKAITLDGGGGQVASVLTSGTPGINVVAGTNDIVTLRNLRFDGLLGTGSPGTNGISFSSGAALIVENDTIFGFGTWGISFAPSTSGTTSSLYVVNSVLSNNGVGSTGGGIVIVPGAGASAKGTIAGTKVLGGAVGIRLDGANTSSGSSVTVENTVSSGSGHSGFVASTTNGAVTLIADQITSSGNNVGVAASGSGANVYLGRSVVTGNNTGISQTNSGVVQSYKNNQINGNNTDGTPITAAPGLN